MYKTRTFFGASEQLLKCGMVPYVYYPEWEQLASVGEFFTSRDEQQHYEVSVPEGGEGSWWLPVGPGHSHYWERTGGARPLQVEPGSLIQTETASGGLVLRPRCLLYWFPDSFWRVSRAGPGEVPGRVGGAFPREPPRQGLEPAKLERLELETHAIELEGLRFALELPRGLVLVREPLSVGIRPRVVSG